MKILQIDIKCGYCPMTWHNRSQEELETLVVGHISTVHPGKPCYIPDTTDVGQLANDGWTGLWVGKEVFDVKFENIKFIGPGGSDKLHVEWYENTSN